MKILILTLLSLSLQAKTIFVSSTQVTKTITQVNALSVVAGDSVLFNRGETFYGGLVTKPGVYYGAYGTGERPIITGFKNVSSWTNLGNGVYESNVISALPSCNMVVVGGNRMAQGRYPNAGYLVITSHVSNSSVSTSSSLPNFSGAMIVIRKKRWVLDRNKVTSVSNRTVNYSTLPGSATQYQPTDGWGFFIQNHPSTLDAFGEWYYNPSTKKIRVYMGASPVPVQVATVEDVVTIKGATVENIKITGANRDGVNIAGHNATLNFSYISFCGRNGINSTGLWNNYYFTLNEIRYVNNCAIGLRDGGDNHAILGNYLSDNGVIAGAGDSGDLGQEAIIDFGTNVFIQYNNILRSGYSAIRFGSKYNVYVGNNYVDTYCLIKDDGSGIYTWNNGPTPGTPSNLIVKDNIILNGVGNFQGTKGTKPEAYGIYMDDNASGVRVEGNTIANTYYGIVSHNGHHISFTGNMVYNCTASAIFWKDRSISVTGLVIKNNIYYGGETARFWDVSGTNTIPQFGVSDSNYYCSKLTNHITGAFPAWNSTYDMMSLSTWKSQTKYGNKDKNSIQVPYKVARFEYNITNTNRVIPITSTYKDLKGNTYTGTVTLKPYTSIILIEQINGNLTGLYQKVRQPEYLR